MSIGATLGVSDSDSTLQLVIDDPSAARRMEIEWVDMTDTPNAQYVLDYTNCSDSDDSLQNYAPTQR